MEVKAFARYIRMTPRKVRLIIDMIRGKRVLEAETILKFTPRLAAKPVLKLLNSAVANGKNNFKLDEANLFIKKITADQGPALKRFRPRAFGRAAMIKKRMSHITIILEEMATKLTKQEKKKETKN
ncbi:MAG: 50S ribosomal protein L22 [Patescibacteria group bacterium]